MKLKVMGGLYLSVLIGGLLGVTPVAFPSPSNSSAEIDNKLEKVLERYWAIEQSLAEDSISGVIEKAELMIPDARSLSDKGLSKDIQNQAKTLASSAGRTSGHIDIERTRDGFKALSMTLAAYLTEHPQKGWVVFHCAVADADWIQKKNAKVGNPFDGKDLSSCEKMPKAHH